MKSIRSGIATLMRKTQVNRACQQRIMFRRLLVEQLENRQLLSATNPLPLASLDGVNGFRIDGIDATDFLGSALSGAGDINGDGFDDLIVGAFSADPGGNIAAGESYVLFGKSGGFSSSFDLTSLDGSNGFRIDGIEASDRLGFSVGGVGDFNGDGLDDLVVGAYRGSPNGIVSAGESYLIFGKSSGFAPAFDVTSLDGTNGFRIDGIDTNDRSGNSVASAGDVNGDGLSDLIIGARLADPGGNSSSGETYILFGQSSGFGSSIALSSLNGVSGFRIDGLDSGDQAGHSVSSAGDVNGDGLADLLIGAFAADPGGRASAGESYVTFGKSSGFGSAISLSSLNGSNGFRIDGIDSGDLSGVSVSKAGDINGDGFDDVIIGAYRSDPGGNSDAGESYLLFGKSSGFASAVALSSLNGTNGFRIDGADTGDLSGVSVSSAGDVDGDGFDDLLIGGHGADPNGNYQAGESYVVFGKSSGFASAFSLSSLNGSNGFRMEGIDPDDRSGRLVSGAGDLNGDGFADFVLGAADADPGGMIEAGESYVIFGSNFTEGVETQVGGDGEDTLTANQGPGFIDRLIGGRGNDTLVSDGGPDVLIGGQGDDTLAIADTDFSSTRRLMGGNGFDTLRLGGSGLTLDLTAIPDNRLVDIEQIDLGTGKSHLLRLTAREVRNLSSHSNTLTVRGSGSRVALVGNEWQGPTLVNIDGTDFRQYTDGSAVLQVETSLTDVTSVIALSSLDGINGFRIDGIDAGDFSGVSVSSAGDINADGFDDLVIGAFMADPSGLSSGEAYVIFGQSGSFSSSISLSSLDGINGFRIDGIDEGDNSGFSVSGAGDVNGDGIDDLIIGATAADPEGNIAAGETYVIFGKSSGFAAAIPLSSLDGSNGFRIDGIDSFDNSGWSVSAAGDINGDGFTDLLIGAPPADPGGRGFAGESYVLFGKSNGFTSTIALSTLNGMSGFRIDGIDSGDRSGYSVSSAGDVNGDGFADLLIGAFGADPGGRAYSGESYVIFGKSSGFASAIALSSLNGVSGFRIDGIESNDESGISVSQAGDVNGDGFDDVLIGAHASDPGGNSRAGESYVIFGKSGGFTSAIAVSSLNGTNGFRIDGIDLNDSSGRSVSEAGDVNGDGFDDLIIGAPSVNFAGNSAAGESYVLFGKPSGFSSAFALSSLNGTNGFRMEGIDALDDTARSVSAAGDVNGDGFSDLILGAWEADPGGNNSAGESYVIFGGNFTGGAETQVGGDSHDTLTANQGLEFADRLIGGRGDDTLVSDGGPDVLIGGHGNDILAIPDVDFSSTRRLVGGNGFDTLRLDGSGLTLDLTAIRDNRIIDIEQIDITGTGDNNLVLNALELLNLSSHSNTLIVRLDSGDAVDFGPGWTQQSSELIEGETFDVFTLGEATIKIQQIPIPASIVASFVNHFGYTGGGSSIDTGKVLARESEGPNLLSYDNLINSSHGINGLVFDIQNLAGVITTADFVFQMSPIGAFDEMVHPVGGWESAPAPGSLVVTSGSPDRVEIVWPDNAISNRWLRVTVLANSNTGLQESEVYYIGHLLGETTGPSGSVFTVSFADITPIRSAVGNSVAADSIADIDKNGTVAFADISAMRGNVGAQLTIITIPAASGGNGETAMFSAPGQDSEMKSLQLGEQVILERFSAAHAAPRIESNASWLYAVDGWTLNEDSSKDNLLRQSPLSLRDNVQTDRGRLRIDVTDHLFGLIESDFESLSLARELEQLSHERVSSGTHNSSCRLLSEFKKRSK